MSSSHIKKIHRTTSYFGPAKVAFIDDDCDSDSDDPKPTLRNLVKPFVIKQWLYKGKLYKEKKRRVPSRFELFFDVVFVAIAHQLSNVAAEQASGAGVVQFILTFFPTWSLWSEVRAFVNVSGTDDILQRVGILYTMAVLVGYTANASAISLFLPERGPYEIEASDIPTIAQQVAQRELVMDGVDSHGRDPALVAAVVFYLLARGLRVVFLAMYAKALPRFRTSLLLALAHQVASLFIYFPLLFVTSKPAIIALASLGMGFDILLRYTVALYVLLCPPTSLSVEESKEADESGTGMNGECIRNRSKQSLSAYDKDANFKGEGCIPAVNIEHFLERTAAFVVIVLGELVFSIVYRAIGNRAGFQHIYGSAICGLVITFNFCWLYFDAECSRRFLHAIRRHWFSGLIFTNLHLPLCASLVVVSAAMSRMTRDPDDDNLGLRWYFGGGLGCAMICMAALGITHRSLDPDGSTRLGRETQLCFRIAAGFALACLPLFELNSLKLMGIAAGITTILVITETYGKLHRGEPLSRLSAAEQDAADAQTARSADMGWQDSVQTLTMDAPKARIANVLERKDSEQTLMMESIHKKREVADILERKDSAQTLTMEPTHKKRQASCPQSVRWV